MTTTELISKLKNNEEIEDLPILKGSEKQIKFAESLRKKWIPKMKKSLTEDFLIFGWEDEDIMEEMKEELLELINTDDASLIIAWEKN